METMTKQPKVKNYINGKFIDDIKESMEVISPLDGSVISSLPISNSNDLDQAVSAANKAYPLW